MLALLLQKLAPRLPLCVSTAGVGVTEWWLLRGTVSDALINI